MTAAGDWSAFAHASSAPPEDRPSTGSPGLPCAVSLPGSSPPRTCRPTEETAGPHEGKRKASYLLAAATASPPSSRQSTLESQTRANQHGRHRWEPRRERFLTHARVDGGLAKPGSCLYRRQPENGISQHGS